MRYTFDSTIQGFLCGAQWRRLLCAVAAGVVLVGTLAATLSTAGAQIAKQGPQAAVANAAGGYGGIWYDDTGQGAVEIGTCRDRLCGRIVWLREPVDKAGRPLTDGFNSDPARRQRPICGLPVIGDLKRQGSGAWDEGWIYDPKQGKQFDVELKLRTADALQVTGYLGFKFLSETFVWRRAPADLKRCG
jgi:uncharacterized protein (DUF2147 family)